MRIQKIRVRIRRIVSGNARNQSENTGNGGRNKRNHGENLRIRVKMMNKKCEKG